MEEARARYANPGGLVRAAGQLVICRERTKKQVGDHDRQIETCTRPRSTLVGEQEGLAGSLSVQNLWSGLPEGQAKKRLPAARVREM